MFILGLTFGQSLEVIPRIAIVFNSIYELKPFLWEPGFVFSRGHTVLTAIPTCGPVPGTRAVLRAIVMF